MPEEIKPFLVFHSRTLCFSFICGNVFERFAQNLKYGVFGSLYTAQTLWNFLPPACYLFMSNYSSDPDRNWFLHTSSSAKKRKKNWLKMLMGLQFDESTESNYNFKICCFLGCKLNFIFLPFKSTEVRIIDYIRQT